VNVKLGLYSALSACVLGTLYTYFYYQTLFDFSAILPLWKVSFGLISFTLILFYMQSLFCKLLNHRAMFWFSLSASIGSFVSIIYPITERVYVDASEFYPGFVIPLHFLPTLMFITFYHLFTQK